MYDESLDQVFGLLHAGRREAAQALLIQYIRDNPRSDQAWYLLSVAVEDRDRQLECLRRALQINPDHRDARARLDRLTTTQAPAPAPQTDPEPLSQPETPPATHTPSAQPPAARPAPEARKTTPRPEPPPRRAGPDKRRGRSPKRARARLPLWAWAGLLSPLLLVLAVAAAYAFNSLQASQARRAEATRQAQQALSTAIARDLPPTWTPAVPVTANLTPTPSQTPTLPPPAPELAAEMLEINDEVSALRGLDAVSEPPVFIIQDDQVRAKLESMLGEDRAALKDEVADQAVVLRALGLIEPGYDLYTKMLNNLGDSLGGFYIPWTKEIYVIGEEFSALERFIYSHEYNHALVDGHFRIDQLGVYPECLHPAQQCEALRALIEGDASLLMYQWLEDYIVENEEEALEIFEYDPPTEIISSADFPPPYVVRENNFYYGDGTAFVEHLYNRGTWALVDLAYQNPPATTEQILHPEKYLAGEEAVSVDARPLDAALGEGWRLLDSDSLGELKTAMVLGHGVAAISQLDPLTAEAAAAGWGGDRYQVYYRGSTNATVLVAHWVWDTPDDAAEFAEAMQVYLHSRYAGARLDRSRGECWERLNQEATCLYATERETLWVLAPDEGVLENVAAVYPDFPQ